MDNRHKKTILDFNYDNTNNYFTKETENEFLNKALPISLNSKKYWCNKNSCYYLNVACSFDIESTSVYIKDEEVYNYDEYMKIITKDITETNKFDVYSGSYIQMININGYNIIYRKWEDTVNLFNTISKRLKLNEPFTNKRKDPKTKEVKTHEYEKRIVFYVHNLNYEWSFIKYRFNFVGEKSFFGSHDDPYYATTDNNIEFRCSFKLTNFNLFNVGKNLLHKYKFDKMVGDLDYLPLRGIDTKLTDKEIKYCLNDVNIVSAYIHERLERGDTISKIPLTNTGELRIRAKHYLLYTKDKNGKNKNDYDFIKTMERLNIKDFKLLKMMKKAFCGGYTHANITSCNKVIENVQALDFTSSYPTVMCVERFPMTTFIEVDVNSKSDFYYYLDRKACLFEITFYNLEYDFDYEFYISESKCDYLEEPNQFNGRIYRAKKLTTTITEVDFEIIRKNYKFTDFKVNTMYVANKDYLPKKWIEFLLLLYKEKTEYKGVQGKEAVYQNSKANFNSTYGMSATFPIHTECTLDYENDDLFIEREFDFDDIKDEDVETLEKIDKSCNKITYFGWSPWITAYARRNLWEAVFNYKDKGVYKDTDSIYYKVDDEYQLENDEFYNNYNKNVLKKINRVCKHYDIDPKKFSPITKDGKVKTLGFFDDDGFYKKFKTLGAKKYLKLTKDNELIMTVSGINKKDFTPYYLNEMCNGDINKAFEMFDDSLVAPPLHSGNKTVRYFDIRKKYKTNKQFYFKFTDLNGMKTELSEYSGCHIMPSEYKFHTEKTRTEQLIYDKTRKVKRTINNIKY